MLTINHVATAAGGGGAFDIAGSRDVQAALRNLQAVRGHTPAAGPQSMTARPVVAVAAVERGTILATRTPGMADDPDAPTGPRPTFHTTPLERLRLDVMAPTSTVTAHAQGAPEDADPPPAEEVGHVASPYGDAKLFTAAAAAPNKLDMVT